jgi:carboxypeptidase C (cathepsin A)
MLKFAALATIAAKPAEDKFDSLPNGEDTLTMPTESYSGYINATDTKLLHYTFVESQQDPANAPVLIWFNGGPGCSSMLGFMQENGPLIYEDETNTISMNQ